MTAVFCFRNDLRLKDNPGLLQAAQQGEILPLYIIDHSEESALIRPGAASNWWLYHSLRQLDASLGSKRLLIAYGNSKEIWAELLEKYNINAIFWNKSFDPRQNALDYELSTLFSQQSVVLHSYNATLLWEPENVRKIDGDYYKVFTPFYRNGCLKAIPPRAPLEKPRNLDFVTEKSILDDRFFYADSDLLQKILLPSVAWYSKLESLWDIGEVAAEKKMRYFLQHGLSGYKNNRNYPAKPGVSRLAPHLHFGEISVHSLWHSASQIKSQVPESDLDCFLSELGWREFAHYLLHFFPELNRRNFQAKFDKFPWKKAPDLLAAWKQGRTGYPIVDAGMRELWQTGYMHNRVRMIVGSFLVKNLLIDWRYGEQWFWDCLLDADLANNSAGWQWVAGSGADAAPYFRIFNPILQGEKFDPEGTYLRRFVPELSRLPNKYLFRPWEAPAHVREEAGVTLGANYPWPIVTAHDSREAALTAYKQLA